MRIQPKYTAAKNIDSFSNAKYGGTRKIGKLMERRLSEGMEGMEGMEP